MSGKPKFGVCDEIGFFKRSRLMAGGKIGIDLYTGYECKYYDEPPD